MDFVLKLTTQTLIRRGRGRGLVVTLCESLSVSVELHMPSLRDFVGELRRSALKILDVREGPDSIVPIVDDGDWHGETRALHQ